MPPPRRNHPLYTHGHIKADSLWVSGAADCLSGGEMNKSENISVQKAVIKMWGVCDL